MEYQVLFISLTGEILGGGYTKFNPKIDETILNFENDMPSDLVMAWKIKDGKLVSMTTLEKDDKKKKEEDKKECPQNAYNAAKSDKERVEVIAKFLGWI